MNNRLKGPALSDAVRTYIRQYILDNNLRPGDALPPEGKLARDLGVGRSSIREAIKGLQSLGIIEIRHGDGIYVREWNFDPFLETLTYGLQHNPGNFIELLQVRIWLEAAVIGDAVKLITPELIQELQDIMGEWEERYDKIEPFSDIDERFHSTLYASLNNRTLLKLMNVFWDVFRKLDDYLGYKPNSKEEYKNHLEILMAIETGDVDLSRKKLIASFYNLLTFCNKKGMSSGRDLDHFVREKES